MKKVVLVAALALVACLCVGCAASAPSSGQTGDFTIVTSFYPMYLLTQNVVGDIPGVTVHNMAAPDVGCLHDYQLLPADLRALESADALVINGAGMESFLDKVREVYPSLPVIEASAGIALLDNNPHVWVDPRNAAIEVKNIAQGLAALLPAQEKRLAENSDAYRAVLEQLYARMVVALDGITQRDIVTFHEAFPYFAAAFSLRIAAVIEREPGTEPSTRELAEIVDTVKASGVRALFAEPQYADRAAEVIARETGAHVYTLDPVVTGPMSKTAYQDAMERNLGTLLTALK